MADSANTESNYGSVQQGVYKDSGDSSFWQWCPNSPRRTAHRGAPPHQPHFNSHPSPLFCDSSRPAIFPRFLRGTNAFIIQQTYRYRVVHIDSFIANTLLVIKTRQSVNTVWRLQGLMRTAGGEEKLYVSRYFYIST
jgi:hypothetical protein